MKERQKQLRFKKGIGGVRRGPHSFPETLYVGPQCRDNREVYYSKIDLEGYDHGDFVAVYKLESVNRVHKSVELK